MRALENKSGQIYKKNPVIRFWCIMFGFEHLEWALLGPTRRLFSRVKMWLMGEEVLPEEWCHPSSWLTGSSDSSQQSVHGPTPEHTSGASRRGNEPLLTELNPFLFLFFFFSAPTSLWPLSVGDRLLVEFSLKLMDSLVSVRNLYQVVSENL